MDTKHSKVRERMTVMQRDRSDADEKNINDAEALFRYALHGVTSALANRANF